MLRGAARRLSRRALRAAGALRAPLPTVEALCPPGVSAETAARWRGPPCCARGFSASGPPPGGEAPPPPGAGATPGAPPPLEGDSSETKKQNAHAKTPKETPESVMLPRWGSYDELRWSAVELSARAQLAVYTRFFEPGFDEAAFLEGAENAYYAINELWPKGDAKGLAPLTSRRVAASFAAMLLDYRDKGLVLQFRTLVFHRARIISWSLLSSDDSRRPRKGASDRDAAEAMTPGGTATGVEGDGKEEEEEEEERNGFVMPGIGPIYLSMDVRYDVEDVVVLREGGPQGPVVGRMRDLRGHVWTFARPLPKEVPFEGADTPWKLTNVK